MKKERAIPMILSVALALCLVGCGEDDGPNEEVGQEEPQQSSVETEQAKTNDFQTGTTEYYIDSLFFDVPTTWTFRNASNGSASYFYPPSGDGLDLMMVSMVNTTGSILDDTIFSEFLSGVESGSDSYQLITKQYGTNAQGKDFAFVSYLSLIEGYNMQSYICGFDCSSGYTLFSFAVRTDSPYDYSNDISAIYDSVREASNYSDTAESKEPDASMGELNALEKALSYLNYTSFSRSGLIDQLEYEGFSTEEATYGVDNCGADWNEQAAKKAQSYLDYSSFSRQGLIDQLVFEGFTQEQAEYGVSAVGY
jgi:hypothetical protein